MFGRLRLLRPQHVGAQTKQMSILATEGMSSVETKQITFAEPAQASSAEMGQICYRGRTDFCCLDRRLTFKRFGSLIYVDLSSNGW